MKKSIIVLSLFAAVLGVTSCEKKENTEVRTEDSVIVEDSMAAATDMNAEAAAAADPQAELIKKAQSYPLTSLALSENHFDFKSVKKGEKVKHVYEVTNTGENPLIISQVKPACGCTAPDYTTTPILPGQKGSVTLEFDSSSFDGLQNKQAEIFANVEKPVVITFSANVVN
ncbi:DUF1573 domain-containing protein [Marnyiella aurantia]|uniref:DUF1573 domain-containing protein n=1 Tax=Marnyiella aurantia TaxID=2758037 RepID=A0A7D7QDW1_9FLAO|nr:DUF1573 domain-containing protein [Marnyiella aurantia]MBA5247717.1 DUF1573 domain-containing protein [Marnyiella aurantia]QMS97301.1 DUF1573 domain-containing protein [Marnyiella aurantia]